MHMVQETSSINAMIYALWKAIQDHPECQGATYHVSHHSYDVKDRLPYLLWAERKLFLTVEGYFGLGPKSMRPGDELVFISEVGAPLVVRRMEDGSGYMFIGAACAPGIHGEISAKLGKNDGQLEGFELR
ncbi:hypothetical protein K458DRAFT_389861 [Lentithecium fluviatile CBS 122367]|uniref:Heterokaryon incompatibility domain-containing protein n=1 Tax=Lentithecium fluviatile CBS 122367 TaxID=1168545 RepID=A0A6G1IZ60_9PLEO|nr:hypothetical protein K458DRAFT_389861 [Lentithecium fluviatile CBS 122367]